MQKTKRYADTVLKPVKRKRYKWETLEPETPPEALSVQTGKLRCFTGALPDGQKPYDILIHNKPEVLARKQEKYPNLKIMGIVQ